MSTLQTRVASRILFALLAIVSITWIGDNALAQNAPLPQPLPVPPKVRVSTSVPRTGIWESLSPGERKFAIHLTAAARAGRDILFIHNHRHGLALRKLIETSLLPGNIERTKAILGAEAFTEFLNFGAKFEDLASPYSPANRKYILSKSTPDQIRQLFKLFGGRPSKTAVSEMTRLLTDPAYEVLQLPEDALGTGLELTGGNFYEKGITGKEVSEAVAKGFEVCLNCRIVRDKTGALTNEVQTVKTPGVVGKALSRVVRELERALPYAQTERQRSQLKHTIRYFKTGDLEDFRQANIDWVKDGTSSKVDFMLGFIEVYQDYNKKIGSWESYVQVVDPETTQVSVRLAKDAQYFENLMPYGKFKKTFPADYSPPALMVYYFQEISSMRSGGYNLPNYDDIRRDVGAKNVIRLSLPGEDANPEVQKIRREMYDEFLPASLVERAVTHWLKARRVMVLLHEIIGHGSGTYDESKYPPKKDPISELGNLGSALEEQRADLTALIFAGDRKLTEVGIYKDAQEAELVRRVMYDTYLSDMLRSISHERTLMEDHARGNWLFIHMLMEKGAIGWVARDGSAKPTLENQVWAVKDYDKFREVGVELLSELQRIKAVRDLAALDKLFEEHAPVDAIHEPWAQAIVKRGEGLAINWGSIEQPWRVGRGGKFELLCEDLLLEKAAQAWTKW